MVDFGIVLPLNSVNKYIMKLRGAVVSKEIIKSTWRFSKPKVPKIVEKLFEKK